MLLLTLYQDSLGLQIDAWSSSAVATRLRNETVFDNGRDISLGAGQMSRFCQLLSWWVVLQEAVLAPANFLMNEVYQVSKHGIFIFNSAFKVKLHLLVCCFGDWFWLIFLPGVSSNYMQRSKSLYTAHIASEKFCRSLPSQKWMPFLEHGFQEFTFENYKCLCNLWNESGIWKWHFPSCFASQGLSSLFKVFLPFLHKKNKIVHPCCKDMWELPDCITTGTVLSRSKIPEKLRSCTGLWLSFAHLRWLLHKQGEILMPSMKKNA